MLKIKKLYIYICLLFIGITITACEEDFLDVNEDPNQSTAADPSLLFTGALNDYANNRVIDYGSSGSFWAQTWSSGGSLTFGTFNNPERYIISIFTNGNTWRGHFRDIQKNLGLATEIALNSEPENRNAAAQSIIFRGLTYYTSTLIWGDIPFSESFGANVDFPKFDEQEDVLNGIIVMLDSAKTYIDVDSPIKITSNDLIYKGDMEKWRKFANSLKFRTLMTMVDKDPGKAGEIAKMIAEGDMISSQEENATFPFFDQPGNKNPRYRILDEYTGGTNLWFIAPKVMVDLMKENNDPRLSVYFQPGRTAEPGEYSGVAPGANGTTSTSVINEGILQADDPDILFTFSEQLFMEAEAHARDLAPGGLAVADTKMREAISANMRYWGVTDAETSEYLNSIPSLTTLGQLAAREKIETELWLSLQLRPFEAWVHWRRGLEVPELPLPIGTSASDIIRRLPYPPDELSANVNAPAVIKVDVKQWFDL